MPCSFGDFHLELMAAVDENKVAVAVPRNHAKTTLLGFFYTLFCLCERIHDQIVIVSSSLGRACETLEKVRTELEENESIRSWYGDLTGKKWTNECLLLSNKTSVIARGYGQSLRGTNLVGRPSLAICDDLEDDEMVLNEERRRKFEQWFFGVVRPSLRHPDDSQMLLIGTLLHPEAFLSRMVNGEFPGWRTRVYQALVDEGLPTQRSLWPAKFSVETLLAERETMGPLYFAHEYQNQPISDSDRVFHEDWIRFFKEVPTGSAVYITCDPGLQAKSSADYTAITVCAVDAQKKMYVLEAIQERMLPKDIIQCLYNLAIRHKARTIGIEDIAYQKSLIYDMQDTFRKNAKWVSVTPLKSGNVKKELRVKSLQPKFQNGEIFFRETGQEELIRQIKLYTAAGAGTKHDDLIDALAYQIQIIGPGKKIKASDEDTPPAELHDNTYIVMKKKIQLAKRLWGRRGNEPYRLSSHGR